MSTHAIEHSDNLGCPPLGQQVHLEVQMIAAIGNDADPVLPHQDKGRDQHRLERGNSRQ